MADSKLNIRQRILAVLAGCGAVGKDRKAPAAAGGYAFSGIDDVIEHLRPHLIEHGVVIVPTVIESSMDIREGRNGKPTAIERQTVEVSFQNADQPDDAFSVQVVGMAIGSGDKNPGIAYSYALKTALLAVFNLRGQPDAENGAGDQLPRTGSSQHPTRVPPPAEENPPPAREQRQSSRPAEPPREQPKEDMKAAPGQINAMTALRNDPRATEIMHKGVSIAGHLVPLIKDGCTFIKASEMIHWVQRKFKEHAAQQKGEAA